MIDPVRPIALEDIEQARERIAGTVLRTPLVRLDLGDDRPESASSSKICSRPTPTRSAARPMRSRALSDEERAQGRLDDQRRQCRAGRRLCGAAVRHSVHGRRDRDRAADQARPDAGARRDDRAGLVRPTPGWRRRRMNSRARRHVRPSVRQSRLHRRSRHDGPGDPRGLPEVAHRHLRRSAAAG